MKCSVSDSVLIHACIVPKTLQIALAIGVLVIRGILPETWVFGRIVPCQKVLLLKRWGNKYKIMSVYQRFVGASRLDSDRQGTKRFRDCVLLFGLLHCVRPDVRDHQSPFVSPMFPFSWLKRSLNFGLGEDGFEEPARPLHSQLGIISLSKPFLTPNSDILNIGLLKCQVHELLDQ